MNTVVRIIGYKWTSAYRLHNIDEGVLMLMVVMINVVVVICLGSSGEMVTRVTPLALETS